MKYALSLLISVTLFFLIPLILGDTFFKGTMVGDAFTTIAFFTFDFTFDHLGVENFYRGIAIGTCLGLLLFFLPVLLFVSKMAKRNKISMGKSLVGAILACIGIIGAGYLHATVLARPTLENPDIRASVLDQLKPGTRLSQVREFIPRNLYTRRYRPIPIASIADGLAWNEAMDPNKVFLSPDMGEAKSQLDLFVDGINTDYHVKIFFTEDDRLCGIYYAFSFAKRYSSDADKSDWIPSWPFVRYSQILLQSPQFKDMWR